MLLTMFLAFIQVGLFSVGGGYAAVGLIREQIVNRHELLTIEAFSDLITVAEMTPGPIAVNAATFVGMQVAGVWGAVVCTLGCILVPCLLCALLARLYDRWRSQHTTRRLLEAMRPAVVALVGSAAVSLTLLALFGANSVDAVLNSALRPVELTLFLGSLVLLRMKKSSPVGCILLCGLLGSIAYALLGVL